MKIQINGFATPDENYWHYLLNIRTTVQQCSCLTLIEQPDSKGIIKISQCAKVEEALQKCDKDIILHAWPGEFRTYIFRYTIADLRREVAKKIASKSTDWKGGQWW